MGDILTKTIKRLLRRRSYSHLRKMVNRTHSVDLARNFTSLSLSEELKLYELMDDPAARGTLLTKLDQDDLRQFTAAVPLSDLMVVAEHVPAEDLADLMESLPVDIGCRILEGLQKKSSEEVGDLLQYGRKTAGGIMATDCIALPLATTAREAIRRYRKSTKTSKPPFISTLPTSSSASAGYAHCVNWSQPNPKPH